ncbi:MAG: superoxide dismutase, partial [Gaiellaceae bacterium]
ATPDGRTLVAVQSETGKLFLIDRRTGATRAIDLGGATLPNGDGILLVGKTLYVVQNQLNKIAVVRLSANLQRGSVTRTITDSDFDVPTTIARFGKWLYAVNARFGTASGPDPRYDVVKVRR